MSAILIVDDEIGIRRVIRGLLDGGDYEIHEASNGEQALTRLRSRGFDLVIMDVMMPGKGGLDTLLEIHEEFPQLKVIVMSGKFDVSSSTFQNLASHFGASSILPKPIDSKQLVSQVSSLLKEA